MKNVIIAAIFCIALAGVSSAQGKRPSAGRSVETRMAVVEFTPGSKASGMTDQAKMQVQTALAAALANSRAFYIYDVRHTRNASQADLAAINGASTSAAMKVGKQLGVAYVITGTVTDYDTSGSAAVKFRVVEVATGRIKHSGEISQSATMRMTGNAGAAEMQAKVMKPLVVKLKDSVLAAF